MDTPFNPKIAISTPFAIYPSPAGGKRLPCVSVEWHRARQQLVIPCGYNFAEIYCDGWETGVARERVAKEAIERGVKYLFFLDWDVLPPGMTLARLVYLADNNPDFDIFAGIYCMKRDPAEVMVWKEWGNGLYWDFRLGDVLTDVVGVGTGCMLIRLSLFERLSNDKPWFKTVNEIVENPDGSPVQQIITDDLYFCKRAVEEANARILVDTGILCGHINVETGQVYTLPEDSLPMRRYRKKQVEEATAAWLTESEQTGLFDLASEASKHSDGKATIVEIGSFLGMSAEIICRGMNGNGKLYCIDPWDGSGCEGMSADLRKIVAEHSETWFRENLRRQITSRKVLPVKGRSVEQAERLGADGIRPDMVFIDGDHGACGEDIAAWLPLVREGGIVCGHDYRREFPDVVRDVDQAFGKVNRLDSLWWTVKETANV